MITGTAERRRTIAARALRWLRRRRALHGYVTTALDVSHVAEGDELVVTVSLLYRAGANRSTVPVATVRVAADRPVEVGELRRYGVEPITLSIVSIPATYAFAPRGVSVSAYVDVKAAPVGPNAAAYRVTITNRAPFPLMWFRFEAHRCEGSPISGVKRANRDFPLVMPNGEYTFELPSGSMGQSSGDDPGAWHPVDLVEVTSLMWQDGAVEGSKETAAQKYGWDRQRSNYLRAVLTILRADRRSITALRDDISNPRPPDVEMEQVRAGLIEQLDRFARRHCRLMVSTSRPGSAERSPSTSNGSRASSFRRCELRTTYSVGRGTGEPENRRTGPRRFTGSPVRPVSLTQLIPTESSSPLSKTHSH